MDRRTIERQIIEASQTVDVLQPDWYTSKEFYLCCSTFQKLVKYYRTNYEDDQISVDVAAEFTSFMRVLRRNLYNKNLSPVLRERILDELSDLDAIMEEIIRMAVHYDD